jgi:hypothetical protein
MGRLKNKKYDNAVELYNSGMSIGDCATYYCITRQAMHIILKRRGCIFRENIRFGEDNTFYRNSEIDNSKKKRVQHIVEKAIKKGVLINPNKCESCKLNKVFSDGRSGIHAHHCDYNKPLDVMWLCQKCHHNWHKNNTALNQIDI